MNSNLLMVFISILQSLWMTLTTVGANMDNFTTPNQKSNVATTMFQIQRTQRHRNVNRAADNLPIH
jgi:hypothetical protein